MVKVGTRAPVTSPRWAASVAGDGLLLMAVLVPYAVFFAIKGVVTADPVVTVDSLRVSEGSFRSGIAALLVVVLLDLVVAWALYFLFEGVHARVSLLAAWFRLAYAAILAAALANLLDALLLVTGSTRASTPGAHGLSARVGESVTSFYNGWDLRLAIFGLHLVCVGFLAWRSGFLPRWLAVLLGIAGIGYLVDSFGTILVP